MTNAQEFSDAVDRVEAYIDAFVTMEGPYSKETIGILGVDGKKLPLHVADLRLMVDSATGRADPQVSDG